MHHSATLAALVAAAAMLSGCKPAEQPDPNAIDEPVLNLPSVPAPEPPLARAELLAAVAAAASAKAAGANDSEAQRQLDGRPFEIRIRFGCRGPVDPLDSSWLGWSHDAEKGTLRLRAMPTINAEDEVVTAIGGEGFEAVEGFWIPRPWLLDSVCPAAPTPAPEPAAPVEDAPPADRSPAAAPPEPVPSLVRPRVGIAQFFTESDPRTGRRSARPYSAVKNLKEGEQVGGEGFNLVLSGRLQALPGRRIIECSARGPDQPPDCIVSADFDRVWIETPASREVLAEWTSG